MSLVQTWPDSRIKQRITEERRVAIPNCRPRKTRYNQLISAGNQE